VRLDARQKRNIFLIFESMLKEETKAGSGLRFKDCPLSSFSPMHVKLLRDRKNKAPSQANRRVMYVRMAFDWAIEEREAWVKANPATGVKDLKYKKQHFHTWTRDEIKQFEATWPIGTTQRLAMAVLAFTGTRRSDAVRLGPPMVKDDKITFTPAKTRNSTGKVLTLPVLGALQTVLDASDVGDKTWLITKRRKPWKEASFGNEFREWCDKAACQIAPRMGSVGPGRPSPPRMARRSSSSWRSSAGQPRRSRWITSRTRSRRKSPAARCTWLSGTDHDRRLSH
jgi:integrase